MRRKYRFFCVHVVLGEQAIGIVEPDSINDPAVGGVDVVEDAVAIGVLGDDFLGVHGIPDAHGVAAIEDVLVVAVEDARAQA